MWVSRGWWRWCAAALAEQLGLEAGELVSEVLEDRQYFCELGAGGKKIAGGRRDLNAGGRDFCHGASPCTSTLNRTVLTRHWPPTLNAPGISPSGANR
jgi:hypothetical protein